MIEMQNVERIFQVGEEAVRALREIHLQINTGEYVAVMGPSGSGKSTLLHIIGLLDRPDAGTYLLDGIDTNSLNEEQRATTRRRKIGFVFQFFHLIPRLSAAQNIELPLVLAGLDPDERRTRVQTALGLLSLEDRAHHRPDQLSGGQRQRVAIARAMILEPAVLLADEPTGNLDRASGHDVIGTLEDLNREGITLIVVTHDPELGARAQRQIHMVDGRIQ